MNERLLITIATYNEIENLPSLVTELRKRFAKDAILVVDDNSPDGTSDWVAENSKTDSNLFLIRRVNERGLGSATIAGFRWGLERDFDLIATMDADFSHPPEDLLAMCEQIRVTPSTDVVVGSRYVEGGGIIGWPLLRRIGSRIVNWFSRFWLGLRTRDNTGAFRVYRASVLTEIGLADVESDGYGYLEEIMMLMHQNNAKIVEHPFWFADRTRGKSKLGLGVGLAVLWEIFWMRFKRR